MQRGARRAPREVLTRQAAAVPSWVAVRRTTADLQGRHRAPHVTRVCSAWNTVHGTPSTLSATGGNDIAGPAPPHVEVTAEADGSFAHWCRERPGPQRGVGRGCGRPSCHALIIGSSAAGCSAATDRQRRCCHPREPSSTVRIRDGGRRGHVNVTEPPAAGRRPGRRPRRTRGAARSRDIALAVLNGTNTTGLAAQTAGQPRASATRPDHPHVRRPTIVYFHPRAAGRRAAHS